MGKRGGSTHLKRTAVPKAVPITDKKEMTWIIKPAPGPHSGRKCIALGVLLRDIFKLGETMAEVKKALHGRAVLVDGVARADEKFPVGLMDVVTIVPEKKSYRMIVDWKARLVPVEIPAADAQRKISKVANKNVMRKGRICLTLHDGRNIISDNHIRVGDSLLFEFDGKGNSRMAGHLRLANGARCLVSDGKHAGMIVTLKEIIKRAGRKSDAVVEADGERFITVADYLHVVDEKFDLGGVHGK